MVGLCDNCGAALASRTAPCPFCGRIPVSEVAKAYGENEEPITNTKEDVIRTIAETLEHLERERRFLQEQFGLTKHPSIPQKIANIERKIQEVKLLSTEAIDDHD